MYIIDAIRTPIGKYGGALSNVRPDDLLADVIKALVGRNPGVDPGKIEDVIAGAANQAGEDNRDVARMSALLAGLPVSVGGNTVNRLCASGLQAVIDASRALQCGEGEFYIAGGVESMTRAPFVMGKTDAPWSRKAEIFDTTIGWRFINPRLSAIHHPYSMGETAENVAKQWNIPREAQDEFAYNSQLKYQAAYEAGKFREEMLPVTVELGKGKTQVVDTDEHPRLTPLDKLATLKPAFVKDGTVTAANASGVNDGAAALLLASEAAVKKYSLKPIAKVIGRAVAGVDPSIMGIGPVPASKKAIERAGLQIADIGLAELNEAFASQSIACIQELGLNPDIVNVNGGAIALGHPLGCSGARISTTLLYEMRRRKVKYGLATMCIGVGQGAAVVYELCD
ncbi:MAG: beta-ketoadipyl CoA thiolase [Bacteroidetes bacterium 47-18]|mgnify:CR=1 FL=1|nr:MAG: beta-ketoadipyl CoA thiolase [Bacteroidetes bacterium 47-18]